MAKQIKSKHVLLSEWIKTNISNGSFLPGDKIPSEHDLASQFQYSRQTVRQAIGNLVAEGILSREQGSGTYVNTSIKKDNNNKTMRIGVITTYFDDYIFPSIIHGIEEVLTKNGYTLSLGITHNKTADEENCLLQMIQTGVDGIIIEGTKSALPNSNLHLFQELEKQHIQTVFINSFYKAHSDSYVVMDDIKSGELVTDYLISKGHSKIGGIFKSDDIQGLKRYEGIIKSLKKNGIPLDDNSIFWYTTEDFKYLFNGPMDKILLSRLEHMTSIICYNDQVAAGLIKVLKRANISVPDDISIISFDNSFLAKEMVCNLTSVIYPAKKIGQKAANLLLNKINNPLIKEKITLEPSLKIRGSVKNRVE